MLLVWFIERAWAACDFTINLTQAKGSLSVNFIIYFTVIQTKTYIFHVSTLRKSICDKTTAKTRWSLSKTMFLGVETTLRHTFPSSDLQCLPPDDPRVLCANMGIWLLATHSLVAVFSNNILQNRVRDADQLLPSSHVWNDRPSFHRNIL